MRLPSVLSILRSVAPAALDRRPHTQIARSNSTRLNSRVRPHNEFQPIKIYRLPFLADCLELQALFIIRGIRHYCTPNTDIFMHLFPKELSYASRNLPNVNPRRNLKQPSRQMPTKFGRRNRQNNNDHCHPPSISSVAKASDTTPIDLCIIRAARHKPRSTRPQLRGDIFYLNILDWLVIR